MAAPHMSGAECPLARKRIGLLTAWASRAGGGVFEAVAAQATLLRSLGAVPVVIALEDESDTADAGRLAGVELHRVRVLGPRFLGYAPRLGKSLDRARLDLLQRSGPTAEAFTFRSAFPAPGADAAPLPDRDDWSCPV